MSERDGDVTALSGFLMLAASVLAIGGTAMAVGATVGADAGFAALLLLTAAGTAGIALAIVAGGDDR
jgi:hypothetical protein